MEILTSRDINADINHQFEFDKTALHYAAGKGCIEIVELLLEKGANVNAEDKNSLSPLSVALRNGHKTVVNALIEHGADAPRVLGQEIEKGVSVTVDWVRNRIRGKRIPRLRNEHQYTTALHSAAHRGKTELLKLIVELWKVDVNMTDGAVGRLTALHQAAERGHRDAVEFLLDNGVDINARKIDGSTPLHLAAEMFRNDVVQLLVDRKADVNAKTDCGDTPYDLARDLAYQKTMDILKKGGYAPPDPISTPPTSVGGRVDEIGA